MTTKPAPATEVYLGVAIELNGKEILLEPKRAISDIKKYGIEVELPARIELGTVEQGLNSLLDTISPGTQLPNKRDVPTALRSSWDAITSASIAVESFHVKVPGTESEEKNTLYTVGLSATWTGEHGTLFNGVKLRGVHLQVSNEPERLALGESPNGAVLPETTVIEQITS